MPSGLPGNNPVEKSDFNRSRYLPGGRGVQVTDPAGFYRKNRSRRNVPAGRPSIGAELHRRVEGVIQRHPELGYHSTAELVKDLLRRWLEAHEQQEAETNLVRRALEDPLTEATSAAHAPLAGPREIRSVMSPAIPTLRDTRSSSRDSASLRSTSTLKAWATSPVSSSSAPSVDSRTAKSPCPAARSASTSRSAGGSRSASARWKAGR
jgi:Arc/MetJ-type ribon-helix-helix transcriptional regulator